MPPIHPPDTAAAINAAVHPLEVELAEVKGQILTEIRHISHDIKNMMQAMTQFVPRREIDEKFKDVGEKLSKLENRIEDDIAKVERKLDAYINEQNDEKKFQRRTIYGAWVGGGITWIWLLIRFGLGFKPV